MAKGGSGYGGAGAGTVSGQRSSVSYAARRRGKKAWHEGRDDGILSHKSDQVSSTPKRGSNGDKNGVLAASSLRSRVLELALEPQGSREVQRALELASGSEQESIVQELRGNVAKAVQSPHANHVLQKAISVMWPSGMDFVIPELLKWGNPSTIAKHPYGCRVLERLMEFFPSSWLTDFITDLMENLSELCKHPYANFVVQHLCEHGTPEQRKHIVDTLCSDLYGLATNQNACGVVDKALTYADWEDQVLLVESILKYNGLLATMASKRWGFSTAERLLSIARGQNLEEAHAQLKAAEWSLQKTPSGRQLMEFADRQHRRWVSTDSESGGSSPQLTSLAASPYLG